MLVSRHLPRSEALNSDPEADWFEPVETPLKREWFFAHWPWPKLNGLLLLLLVSVFAASFVVAPFQAPPEKVADPARAEKRKRLLDDHMVAPPSGQKAPPIKKAPVAKADVSPQPAPDKRTTNSPKPAPGPQTPTISSYADGIARGDKAHQSKRYKEAASLFAAARKRDPKQRGAYYKEAVSLFRDGQHKEAIAALEATLKKWPKFISAAHLIIQIHEANGNDAAASAALERYLHLEGADNHGKDDFIAEGKRLMKEKKPLEAAMWFRRAVHIAPKDLGAKYQWAKALFLAKKYLKSAQQAEKLLEIESDNLNSLYLAGRARGALKETSRAKQHYKKYLKLAPKGKRAERVKKLIEAL